MPTYQYKALTRSGQMVKNTVSGISKSELVNKLKANDLTPINIQQAITFTQSFLLLKKAQFNNIHALNTVIQSTENPSMKSVLEDILIGVEARRKYVLYNGIL